MKIEVAGKQNVQPWWVNRTVECKHCGQIVRLEKNDKVDDSRSAEVCLTPKDLTLECTNCGTHCTLPRP